MPAADCNNFVEESFFQGNCNDDIDNDGDGYMDYDGNGVTLPDAECHCLDLDQDGFCYDWADEFADIP